MRNLVLNELSLETATLPAKDDDAVLYLKKLAASLISYRKQLKFPSAGILSIKKPGEYSFSTTGSDLRTLWSKLPKDVQDILVAAITQHPLIESKIPPFYYFNGNDALGFAYAYERDLYSISYNNDIWDASGYELTKIMEEEETNVSVEHYTVNNGQQENIKDDFYKTLESSGELWERREDIFPNLVFCSGTQDQICGFSVNGKHLHTIYSKLMVLNKGLENANLNILNYNDLGIKISGESESTLNQYSKERTFSIPNTLREQVFEDHIKLPDIRIHFYLDRETQKCYIGYIGKHLKISSGN